VIRIFITGKYPRNQLKKQNYVVAESESFIVITGTSPYRTFLFDCYSHPKSHFANVIAMEKFWSLWLRCLQAKASGDYFDWRLDGLTGERIF
jgi:hypothetical protein